MEDYSCVRLAVWKRQICECPLTIVGILRSFSPSGIRSFYSRKVMFTKDAFEEKLDAILTEFPILDVSVIREFCLPESAKLLQCWLHILCCAYHPPAELTQASHFTSLSELAPFHLVVDEVSHHSWKSFLRA